MEKMITVPLEDFIKALKGSDHTQQWNLPVTDDEKGAGLYLRDLRINIRYLDGKNPVFDFVLVANGMHIEKTVTLTVGEIFGIAPNMQKMLNFYLDTGNRDTPF